MDQHNATVTSSVAVSIVETAARKEANEGANSELNEKHDTTPINESTNEEMNDCPISTDSLSDPKITAPSDISTNDESKTAKSTNQVDHSESNKIMEIKISAPDETFKNPYPVDHISTENPTKEETIASDTNTQNSSMDVKLENAKNSEISANHKNERDKETTEAEVDHRKKSPDSIKQETKHFAEFSKDSSHPNKKEKSGQICESGKAIDKEGQRTEEIIELHVIEYENENKGSEIKNENTEVIEIVVRSDQKNGNLDVKMEPKRLTPSKQESAASAVNIERTKSSMENKYEKSAENETTLEIVGKHSQNEKGAPYVEDSMFAKSTCPKSESYESIDASNDKSNDDSTSDSTSAETSNNPMKQRSVIEDIFDDWQDENPEEDSSHTLSKSHDSVEMELKILLHDDKSVDEPCKEKNNSCDEISDKSKKEEKTSTSVAMERPTMVESTEPIDLFEKEARRVNKDVPDDEKTESANVEDRKIDKIDDNPMRFMRKKPLAPRPGVKVPGILLSSPIVSRSAVSKVLKERIREQQKDFDSRSKPDIFFVKKITQRLSHKLAAASAAQVPGLLPIQQISKTSTSVVDSRKAVSAVDKELLAILEGDVDPDWSNLKSPSEVPKTVSIIERPFPAKLDPAVERELALKQLLELPTNPSKKVAAKKPAVKPMRAKISKITKMESSEKKDYEKEIPISRISTPSVEVIVKDDSMDSTTSSQSFKADESRSGRKRKPTEKAREHENNAKRQKVLKSKLPITNKRISQEKDQSPSTNVIDKIDELNTSVIEIIQDSDEKQKIPALSEKTKKRPIDPIIKKSADDSIDEEDIREIIVKKITAKPGAKRKVPVGSKLMRQKMGQNKKSTMKAKLTKGMAKKIGTKVTSAKGQKQRNGESTSVEVKPKKKVNEIDRLLQDEGVVNLLYDVEHSDKKRLVPITKSQTKVMDMQKIQRELKIRTKLVKNAVLRLRTSNITTTKVSPRSKRITSHSSDFYTNKSSNEQSKSERSSSPTDFIYPAKIRNAADASIIIRRHSSSSFSSSSASPRASIDAPERMSIDGTRNDETSHLLRSNKRRCSQEDDKKKKKLKQSPEPKKNRRKTIDKSESDSEITPSHNTENKNKSTSGTIVTQTVADGPSPAKLSKKIGKTSKQLQGQVMEVNENIGSGNAAKITTRSNGSTGGGGGGKIMPKSKKSVKCKVTFAKGSETINKKLDSPRQQDELSACLAEAVTALSNDSGGSSQCRSTIPVNRNKTKGNSSSPVKIGDFDEKKVKMEPRVQFSNNEINVQRHGNLVQLLLTPSTSKKIRNGITIQVMQEIRETLSILKKDEDCRVVLLTSTGSSFCEGLDLSTLLHENKEERRLHAEELANGVKEFIKSLATFNKPIVAGVQGTAVGLGVTMLPWFDLVIASDKATFSTPYGKLGQIAEGAAIFTLSHILGSAVTSELLLGGRTLTANEALRAGLVTRVLWPDRFQAELIPSLRVMSEQSSQSMEATKALLRHSLRKKLDAALESECYLLIQHWCSTECQLAITAYVDEKIK